MNSLQSIVKEVPRIKESLWRFMYLIYLVSVTVIEVTEGDMVVVVVVDDDTTTIRDVETTIIITIRNEEDNIN